MIKYMKSFFSNNKEESKITYNYFDSSMLNVDDFNKWFCDKKNGHHYYHKGIFLRVDKLGSGAINDFLTIHHNVNVKEVDELTLIEFTNLVRADWMNKLKLK